MGSSMALQAAAAAGRRVHASGGQGLLLCLEREEAPAPRTHQPVPNLRVNHECTIWCSACGACIRRDSSALWGPCLLHTVHAVAAQVAHLLGRL